MTRNVGSWERGLRIIIGVILLALVLDFAADASAVIVETGAAATARFVDGVAIIVRPIAGAMAEASVGGQQFTYVPK